MNLRSIPVLGTRLAALVLGAALIIQGITTAGFVAIVSLFSTTTGQFLHALALIALGVGILLVGTWMVYAGLLNFPLIRSRIGGTPGS